MKGPHTDMKQIGILALGEVPHEPKRRRTTRDRIYHPQREREPYRCHPRSSWARLMRKKPKAHTRASWALLDSSDQRSEFRLDPHRDLECSRVRGNPANRAEIVTLCDLDRVSKLGRAPVYARGIENPRGTGQVTPTGGAEGGR